MGVASRLRTALRGIAALAEPARGWCSAWHDRAMPRSNNDKPPLFYVADGTWPEVTLAVDAPLSAHCGLLLARDLRRTMRSCGLSLRGLAEVACVAHSTVARVVNGDVLPDIGTLTRLEDALDHQLWPGPSAVRLAAAADARTAGEAEMVMPVRDPRA